ncbi:hypothetical protein BpHYR1_018382 [Brachionus plicatilis]|uniref:Uncharacterized protein n=1 Tax=Brachionus plicatilis TaxID=10195 RepID=A0A3M7P9F8_BRAPC|nr:hypothetical protein BpHYR1_018382 [Brachionus plicatilis]
MQSICEYCNAVKEHLYLITLPCGYVVCHDHFDSTNQYGLGVFAPSLNCFVCKNHNISKKQCYEMAKNRSKLSKIKFLEHLDLVKNKIKYIQEYQNDTDLFLDNYLDPVLNKIDLRREQLKIEVNKKIDEAYFKMIDEIKGIRSNFKQKIGCISLDNEQFEEITKIEKMEKENKNRENFDDKLNKLKTYEKDIIDTANDMIEQLKDIDFKIFGENVWMNSYKKNFVFAKSVINLDDCKQKISFGTINFKK